MNRSAVVLPNDRYANIWALPFVIVVVDQLSKALAVKTVPIVQNTGTIFGLFGNNTIWIVLSVTIVIGMILIAKKRQHLTGKQDKLQTFAMMLVIGGGLSNIIDRLLHGYVIDFIKVPLWPTFNIADACITTGVTLLLWFAFFTKESPNE